MTTTKTKFNELRDAMLLAAKDLGVSEHELHQDVEKWHIDYECNLDRDFKYIINLLSEDTKLFKQAIQRKDMLAARSALVNIQIQTRIIATFFQDIDDDVMRLGWGNELRNKWPKIPEDYQIPSDYDYENTYLSSEESDKHFEAFNAEEDRLDELERRPKAKILTLRKKTSSD